jgi:hypothetical protein
MKFKLGDIVKSKRNTYDKDVPCIVDRIYQRQDKFDMLRLKFYYKGEEKRINVTPDSCKFDISHMRNEKLNKLLT